jgi:hypothetical protein
MEQAQFKKHCDIFIQSQVFAANIYAAFAVMTAQIPRPIKAYTRPTANHILQ